LSIDLVLSIKDKAVILFHARHNLLGRSLERLRRRTGFLNKFGRQNDRGR
jgi:hypothetical protein